jgi:hypothetical protein
MRLPSRERRPSPKNRQLGAERSGECNGRMLSVCDFCNGPWKDELPASFGQVDGGRETVDGGL